VNDLIGTGRSRGRRRAATNSKRIADVLKTVQSFFSNYIQSEDADQPPEHAQQLAAAALLLEVSRSDNDVDDAERRTIEEVVRSKFDLNREEVETLMDLAEQEVREASSLFGFTSLINDHWSMDQRVQLAGLMWQVAFADGHLDDHEVHLMRKIQKLLHIPHKRFIGAKLQAREEADTPDSDMDLR
jgi:uncharacterized tellurite resistance protein B-like protein